MVFLLQDDESGTAYVNLLFFFLFVTTLFLLLCGLGLLSPHTAWTSTTKWRGKSKVNVLLRVEADNERRDVDNLLADTKCAVSEATLQ